MEFHPIANIFPMIEGEEFQAFCRDIQEKGLREPIWLFEGQILDGRNRYRACNETGTDLEFETYEGTDPVGFVVSLNVQRRHMDESQRAMVAARIANMPEGRPSETPPIGGVSQEAAAEMLNVSLRSVQRAAQVQERGSPEVIAAVDAGEVKVSAAAVLVEAPKREQAELMRGIQAVNDGKVTIEQAKKFALVAANRMTNIHVSDESYEWYTPEEYIEAAREVLGSIDLDPASCEKAQAVVMAHRFYSKEEDGLRQQWEGCVWMNPPYSAELVQAFTGKLIEEHAAGRVPAAIALVNNATDADWFQRMLCRYPACFTDGRVKFWRADDLLNPLATRQGQAFFYLGQDADLFSSVFSRYGVVVQPV